MTSTSLTQADDDALTYEQTHVHSVYESIASHFSSTRYKPWPVVDAFLRDLTPGTIGLDVGCGNGKYLNVNKNVFIIGSDRSSNLIALAAQHQTSLPQAAAGSTSTDTKCADTTRANYNADVLIADTLSLPHPPHSFDFAICIAVIHHLSSRRRRIAAIRGILQILKVGNNAQPDRPSQQQGLPRNDGRVEQGFPATRSVNSIANQNSGTDGTGEIDARESLGATAVWIETNEAISSGDEFKGQSSGCVETVAGGGAEQSPRLDGGQDGGIALRLSGQESVRTVAGAEDVSCTNAQDHAAQQRHDAPGAGAHGVAHASTTQPEQVPRQQEADRHRPATREGVTAFQHDEQNDQIQTQHRYQNTAHDQPSLHDRPFRGTARKSNTANNLDEQATSSLESFSSTTAGAADQPASSLPDRGAETAGRPAAEEATASSSAAAAAAAAAAVTGSALAPSQPPPRAGASACANNGKAGQALLFVWALEQQGSRRGWKEGDQQDVLVPWVLKQQQQQQQQKERQGKKAKQGRGKRDGKGGRMGKDGAVGGDGVVREDESGIKGEVVGEHGDAVVGEGKYSQEDDKKVEPPKEQVFGRYYHLYAQGELEAECEEAGGRVVRRGYDRDNWWVVVEPALG